MAGILQAIMQPDKSWLNSFNCVHADLSKTIFSFRPSSSVPLSVLDPLVFPPLSCSSSLLPPFLSDPPTSPSCLPSSLLSFLLILFYGLHFAFGKNECWILLSVSTHTETLLIFLLFTVTTTEFANELLNSEPQPCTRLTYLAMMCLP